MFISPISITSLPSLLDKRPTSATKKIIMLLNHFRSIAVQLGELQHILMYFQCKKFSYHSIVQFSGKETTQERFYKIVLATFFIPYGASSTLSASHQKPSIRRSFDQTIRVFSDHRSLECVCVRSLLAMVRTAPLKWDVWAAVYHLESNEDAPFFHRPLHPRPWYSHE